MLRIWGFIPRVKRSQRRFLILLTSVMCWYFNFYQDRVSGRNSGLFLVQRFEARTRGRLFRDLQGGREASEQPGPELGCRGGQGSGAQSWQSKRPAGRRARPLEGLWLQKGRWVTGSMGGRETIPPEGTVTWRTWGAWPWSAHGEKGTWAELGHGAKGLLEPRELKCSTITVIIKNYHNYQELW